MSKKMIFALFKKVDWQITVAVLTLIYKYSFKVK